MENILPKRSFATFVCCVSLVAQHSGRFQAATISPEAALDRMYNFDFPGAHQILSQWNRSSPRRPASAMRLQAAAYLFTSSRDSRSSMANFLKMISKL